MNGTTTRNTAMWLGLIAVALGAVAIVAIIAGDIRVALSVGTAVAAVGLFVVLVGALFAQYRPMTAGLLMIAGVVAVLVGQWNEISRWTTDLWTLATGGYVSYVDAQGLARTPDFWGVLSGSASMLGYAGTLVTGTIGAIVAGFAPEPEPEPEVERRPAMAQRAL